MSIKCYSVILFSLSFTQYFTNIVNLIFWIIVIVFLYLFSTLGPRYDNPSRSEKSDKGVALLVEWMDEWNIKEYK